LLNAIVACAVSAFFTLEGPGYAWRHELLKVTATVSSVWVLASGLVTFTLSFFLSQSFDLWRRVYSVTRRVQGRLNDLGLLTATSAERDENGDYTDDAEEMLATVARYVRLFNVLLYASVTTRFAPLKTPSGLQRLVKSGHLTADEREALLQSSLGHNIVLEWIFTLLNSGVADGRLGGGNTLQLVLANKVTELRATYASIPDALSGRMPLAYTQLVQILVDVLVISAPLALIHSVGGFGAIVGTALITLFHASILNLAKMFLDPFNNNEYGDAGLSINVLTLMQETNIGSERWRKGAQWVPPATRLRPTAVEERQKKRGTTLAGLFNLGGI